MIHDRELALLLDTQVAAQTEIEHAAHCVDGVQLRDREGDFVQRVEHDDLLDVPLAVVEGLRWRQLAAETVWENSR